jgi:hypothetical protein
MSTHGPRRLDRATAEHLLDGAGTGATSGHEALGRLLAAAAAPPRDGELGGELAAMAAFRAARLTPVPEPRRPSMMKMAMAKLLTVKAAAVLAVTAAGGAALATTTGAVPNPLSDKPNGAAVSAAPSRPGGDHPPSAAAGPDGGGSPSPSLHGLCRAYAAKGGVERGRSLDSSAFRVLVGAAGGKDRVEAYCARLLAEVDRTGGKDADPPRDDRPGNGNGNGHGHGNGHGNGNGGPGNGRSSDTPGAGHRQGDGGPGKHTTPATR